MKLTKMDLENLIKEEIEQAKIEKLNEDTIKQIAAVRKKQERKK